jgi:hypothetical protein
MGQSHSYWTRSFNEESSLLSGAVVGGGAGPAAIYYNPSSISEITESKFSLHASLFSLDLNHSKNALGDGLDISSSRMTIAPRFLSYMLKPKNHPEWSFEFAFLNNENYQLEFTENVDRQEDVLTYLPGEERYYAFVQYRNHFRDDWFGAGGSWNINRELYLGASIFVSVRSMDYQYSTNIDAFPLKDSIYTDEGYVQFYSANYQYEEYLSFNDYRLLGKFGMMYTKNNWSFGLSLTTPSWGVYSDGKRVSRKLKENNIQDPLTGEPLPGFVIADHEEKKAVQVNMKSPFSFAVGVNYNFNNGNRTLYGTSEFFAGIDDYAMVRAETSPLLGAGTLLEAEDRSKWLTFLNNAKPVFNVALGYRDQLKENLMLMAGFRTDFNYRNNIEHQHFSRSFQTTGLNLDVYHLTSGLTLHVLGQDLIAGLQYSFGYKNNQQQIINLSDPVEYNYEERAALQGTRQNTMNSLLNSLSFYFGATFNFGKEQE